MSTQESGGLNVGYYDTNTFKKTEFKANIIKDNYLRFFKQHLEKNKFFLLTYRNCVSQIAKDYICEYKNSNQFAYTFDVLYVRGALCDVDERKPIRYNFNWSLPQANDSVITIYVNEGNRNLFYSNVYIDKPQCVYRLYDIKDEYRTVLENRHNDKLQLNAIIHLRKRGEETILPVRIDDSDWVNMDNNLSDWVNLDDLVEKYIIYSIPHGDTSKELTYTKPEMRSVIRGKDSKKKEELDHILNEVSINFRNYDTNFTKKQIEILLKELRNTKKNKGSWGIVQSEHYGGKRRTRKNKKSKKKLKKYTKIQRIK